MVACVVSEMFCNGGEVGLLEVFVKYVNILVVFSVVDDDDGDCLTGQSVGILAPSALVSLKSSFSFQLTARDDDKGRTVIDQAGVGARQTQKHKTNINV